MLTPKQKKIFEFIKRYLKEKGYSPSLEEMGKRFKLVKSTVHQHVKELKEKGYLNKLDYQARSIELTKNRSSSDLINIPLLGTIAAGQPIEAIEDKETIEVPKSQLFKSGEHFALRVSGNSMIDEGIFNGDTVVIRKQPDAENGETVVALINDNEVTLKKIYKEKNGFRLQPANPELKPIFTKELTIQGKVVSVIRDFEELRRLGKNIGGNERETEKNRQSIKPFVPLIGKNIWSRGVIFERAKPYFEDNNFVLYCGDCLNILNQLPADSVDMIFADPPYNLSNNGFSLHAGKRVSVNKGAWDKSRGFKDDYDFHYKWLGACKRVLKPEGSLWVSGTYHSIYQCGYALQSLGYHILNDISWFKPNGSPNLSCRYFTASHETLIWARRDKNAKHLFNYNLMKNGDWPEDFIKKPNLQMRSVWAIYPPKKSEKEFGKHPTQKPIELLRRIILASTKPNAVILDPFTGSSTTGIASEIIGKRKFIGIDTEREFLDISIKRFAEESMT